MISLQSYWSTIVEAYEANLKTAREAAFNSHETLKQAHLDEISRILAHRPLKTDKEIVIASIDAMVRVVKDGKELWFDHRTGLFYTLHVESGGEADQENEATTEAIRQDREEQRQQEDRDCHRGLAAFKPQESKRDKDGNVVDSRGRKRPDLGILA